MLHGNVVRVPLGWSTSRCPGRTATLLLVVGSPATAAAAARTLADRIGIGRGRRSVA